LPDHKNRPVSLQDVLAAMTALAVALGLTRAMWLPPDGFSILWAVGIMSGIPAAVLATAYCLSVGWRDGLYAFVRVWAILFSLFLALVGIAALGLALIGRP
jgi:hypothetical protein